MSAAATEPSTLSVPPMNALTTLPAGASIALATSLVKAFRRSTHSVVVCGTAMPRCSSQGAVVVQRPASCLGSSWITPATSVTMPGTPRTRKHPPVPSPPAHIGDKSWDHEHQKHPHGAERPPEYQRNPRQTWHVPGFEPVHHGI